MDYKVLELFQGSGPLNATLGKLTLSLESPQEALFLIQAHFFPSLRLKDLKNTTSRMVPRASVSEPQDGAILFGVNKSIPHE